MSFTAIVVAAMRIAEGRHTNPILQDPLLSDLLSSSAGERLTAYKACFEEKCVSPCT